MRSRFKLTPSRKSPLPEKHFMRYECEKGHPIDDFGEEDLRKCLDQKMGCWKDE